MKDWNKFIAPNLGLLFYKQVYKENVNLLEVEVDKLVFKVTKENSEFNPYYNVLYDKTIRDFKFKSLKPGNTEFTLYTTYPGLVAGVGYLHGSKTVGDAAIGFYFDHTSGLPVIPGSSVKGVLRSVFEADANEKSEYTGEKSVAALQFMIEEYEASTQNTTLFADLKSKLDIELVQQLKLEIFDYAESVLNTKSYTEKDVFYDACIDIDACPVKHFIADDYITPHSDPLKNPIPTQFLKVLPDVPFSFRFDLKDTTMSAEQKKALFRQILLTLGIGAKTNVGYGQFKMESSGANASFGNKAEAIKPVNFQKSNIADEIRFPDENQREYINKNLSQEYDAVIAHIKNPNAIVEFRVNCGNEAEPIRLKKKIDKIKGGNPEKDKKVVVKINSVIKPGNNDIDFSVRLKN